MLLLRHFHSQMPPAFYLLFHIQNLIVALNEFASYEVIEINIIKYIVQHRVRKKKSSPSCFTTQIQYYIGTPIPPYDLNHLYIY